MVSLPVGEKVYAQSQQKHFALLKNYAVWYGIDLVLIVLHITGLLSILLNPR
ncbi:hypothetical protein DC3_47830 [Deinococcus cellulosilyticus NBRC 106333 = KACC 11606]|uniref:Uncharacterized protein n=1 Tax=Deinococcus cellulosilyticus (strain DSM 18568 / NBRC 106333 / KACC 11606 / 5516J-15) TaxID=1223518 RepID=A0A511N9H9_DEIC1|nr:hypothetical protein DC3_47830 [Deinococcus cellulosilyticus NBRC 106333 = KACC 11606]